MKHFIFITFSILLTLQPVQAEEKLIFSGLQNSKLGLMVEEVLQQAYQRIGFKAETQWLPGARALRMANSGEFDGAQLRVASVTLLTLQLSLPVKWHPPKPIHTYASVTAGVGSLSGALHGGANTRVMQMLLEIGSVDKVEDYVKNILATGGVIMGLGHAVYQTDDPRAHILAPLSKTLGERAGDTKWYDLSVHLEQVAKQAFKKKKEREIYVNVDFYSATVYHYINPKNIFHTAPLQGAKKILTLTWG